MGPRGPDTALDNCGPVPTIIVTAPCASGCGYDEMAFAPFGRSRFPARRRLPFAMLLADFLRTVVFIDFPFDAFWNRDNFETRQFTVCFLAERFDGSNKNWIITRVSGTIALVTVSIPTRKFVLLIRIFELEFYV